MKLLMKKRLLLLPVILILSGCSSMPPNNAVSYAQSYQLANQYWEQAEQLRKQEKYEDAAEMYIKSAEAERDSSKPRFDYLSEAFATAGVMYKSIGQYHLAMDNFQQALLIDRKLRRDDNIARDLSFIAWIYQYWGLNDKAISHYKEALLIDRRLDRDEYLAINLNNMGGVYDIKGEYNKAITYFEQALAISRKLGKDNYISRDLNSMGLVYLSLGQYDKAITHFEQALVISEKLNKKRDITRDLNSIGMVYLNLGQYDKAIKNYEQALLIARKLGLDDYIAGSLNNMGGSYQALGQYDKAIVHFEQALVISQKLGRERDIARNLNNIGMIYQLWGKYDKAIHHLEQVLAISQKLGMDDYIAGSLNNIAGIYNAKGQYNKAINNFEQALVINKKLGREDDISGNLHNIGGIYYSLKQYDKAIDNLNKSVELKEKLRKTATGDARRDYLASQIQTYQYLIASYFENNELSKAFTIVELSRAKLLGESLAKSQSKINIPSVMQIQSNLSEDTAVITYANESLPETIVIVITKDNIFGVKIDDKKLMGAILNNDGASITTYLKNQREIKAKEQKKGIDKSKIDFVDIVNYYRSMLAEPLSQINRGLKVSKRSFKNKTKDQNLNTSLYASFIKPLEKYIEGKKNLLIIPDGHLSFLPFETLVDDNGRYLVEKYNITYSQSMGVLDLIKKRRYKTNRKSLLAFGGAAYNKFSYDADLIQTEKQLEYLEKKMLVSFQKERSVRNAYASLDLAEWSNLPGSLSEVNNIKKLVSGANVITGDRVTENYVKQLSQQGDLTKYKVIHFATHGLVIPEVPELSAIVLAQFKDEKKGEDGYLRMGEIAKLKINADLVTLSACETGLGKIYSGEGVVGLNQSFLIAGANGLLVSLWQVADLSTSEFMIDMYRIVETKGVGFDSAIHEIKRKFIRGDFGEQYRAPYYWAPFVYYGQFGGYL